MRFEWDRRKAAGNLSKHGVPFQEAASIFGDPLAWTYPDADHSESESRWITIGLSDSRRVLVVAHTEEDEIIRLISARRATRAERRFYEER